MITVPVEVAMNGIPKTANIRSISLYGLSDVIITFNDGTDNEFARAQAFQRIGDASLPSGVTPSISPLSSPSPQLSHSRDRPAPGSASRRPTSTRA